MKRRYLFTLEVAPVEVGKTYDELPSHLTLMSRFWSELSPNELTKIVRPLFEKTAPIELAFGETVELGPKKLTVHLVEHSSELKQLHGELRALLDAANVDYEYPEFIGEGHKPHVTKRNDESFKAGDKHMAHAAYLIEVVGGQRAIRSKFELSGARASNRPSHNKRMLIFISGSINSGKTTTSKLLAENLGAAFINVDDLNDTIPNFNLATDLDKSKDLAIATINTQLAEGKNVVANYVVREKDWQRLQKEVKTKDIHLITLAPRLEVAQSKRGNRVLTDWEVARVKHHYDTGIATPAFGHIIDNSDISPEETAECILKVIGR